MDYIDKIILNIETSEITAQNRRLRAVWTREANPIIHNAHIIEQMIETYAQYFSNEIERYLSEEKVDWTKEGF